MLAVALTELSFQVSGITVNIFSPYTKSSIIEPITISKGFYFYLHLAADRLTNPPTGCFLCFSGCKDKSLFSFLQISRVPILHNGTQTKGFVTNCKDWGNMHKSKENIFKYFIAFVTCLFTVGYKQARKEKRSASQLKKNMNIPFARTRLHKYTQAKSIDKSYLSRAGCRWQFFARAYY